MGLQFGILARLTWWEYSWDIMEPVTYFVTYGTTMAMFAYYVCTKQVKKRFFLWMVWQCLSSSLLSPVSLSLGVPYSKYGLDRKWRSMVKPLTPKYFFFSFQEYNFSEVRDREYLLTVHKQANKASLDLLKYNRLRDAISQTEYDLQRLRDPLQMNLPLQHVIPPHLSKEPHPVFNNKK